MVALFLALIGLSGWLSRHALERRGVRRFPERRVERGVGGVLLVAGLIGIEALDVGLAVVVCAFLVPDLPLYAWLAGLRRAGPAYVALHHPVGPIALAVLGALVGGPVAVAAAIWLAHVGLDRALGYGMAGSLESGLG